MEIIEQGKDLYMWFGLKPTLVRGEHKSNVNVQISIFNPTSQRVIFSLDKKTHFSQ